MSKVSLSPLARLVTDSVPPAIVYWFVVVIDGLAEKIVVQFLFISIVVVPFPAVPNRISIELIVLVPLDSIVLATFVHVVPIVPAKANISFQGLPAVTVQLLSDDKS